MTPERTVLRLARPWLGGLLRAGLLAAGTELSALALLATATWLLVTAAGRPPLDALTVAIVTVRALAIARGVLRYTERLAGHDATLRVVTEVRARIFATLASRPETGPETGPGSGPITGSDTGPDGEPGGGLRTGDTLSRLVSDTEAVQDLLLRVLVPGAAALGAGVLAVAGAAVVSPAAAAALAAGLLLAGGVLPAVAVGTTRRAARRLAPLRGALAVDAVDLTHGAADLAAFGATATALRRSAGRADELARLERRLAAVGWAVDGVGVLLAGVTSAVVVTVGLRAGVAGAPVAVLAVGTLVAVESALALVGAARQWTQLRAGLRRVAALLSGFGPAGAGRTGVELSGAGPGEDPPGRSDATARPPAGRHVRLAEVDARHRSTGAPALHRLTLDLPPGRRVAVVGPSGAGKSTLLAVLAGLLPPARGRVTVDGVELAALPTRARCRAVGGLLADAHVFHTSVRENLLLARPDATDEELTAAAVAAGLDDWVRDQPDGWHTTVGEDGGQLSGGQRQRLLLARALLAAPALLLLDEPTEGLDPAAADRVLASATDSLPPDRSVLLVTHRLAGLAGYDEVLVLDAGRVLQRGRHADLVAAPGWYRDQWLAQEAAERGYAALTPAAPGAADEARHPD